MEDGRADGARVEGEGVFSAPQVETASSFRPSRYTCKCSINPNISGGDGVAELCNNELDKQNNFAKNSPQQLTIFYVLHYVSGSHFFMTSCFYSFCLEKDSNGHDWDYSDEVSSCLR